MSDGRASGVQQSEQRAADLFLPTVMGVLNVTPDSFSDGGSYLDSAAALARAEEMLAAGAQIIDVGGESTRPGATPVSPEEEQRRVLPVVRELVRRGVSVSVDTIHASTAREAATAGAAYINDVSGGLHDPEILRVAAQASKERGVRFIIGHWRGVPDPAHSRSAYADVVCEVRESLQRLALAAQAAGVAREHIILDPGLGFDKTAAQSWQLLAACGSIAELGYPVLIGASRKRMLGDVLADLPAAAKDGLCAGAGWHERDLVTAVSSVHAALAGAWGVRVHNVAATVQALAAHSAYLRAALGTAANLTHTSSAACSTAASNTIQLKGLEFFAHHGVYEHEKRDGQRFVLDLTLTTVPPPCGSDELANTVDYGTLATQVLTAVTAESYDLLERVAEVALETVLQNQLVLAASVTVHKPEAPIPAKFGDVAVTRSRTKQQPVPGASLPSETGSAV